MEEELEGHLDRRQKLNKFKFTLEDLNQAVIGALNTKPEQPQMPGKPNILELMRAKKENKEGQWPLV